VLIHTGAKNFNSLRVVELAIQVNGGYGAGEPLEVSFFDVGDALVSPKPANGLTSNRP
jgi:hypothetical protein